jgi:hypothetical protein
MGVVVGAILVHMGVHLFQLVIGLVALARPADWPGADFGWLGEAYVAGYFIFGVAAVMGNVAWFRWLDHSVKNLYADGIVDTGLRPLDVVGAWFVPGVNLFRPLRHMRRLYQCVAGGNRWRRCDPPRIITIWWLASLAQLALIGLALWRGDEWLWPAASATGLVVATLALMILRRFARVEPHWSEVRRTLRPLLLPAPKAASA